MALTISSIRDEVAQRLYGYQAYTSLTTGQKSIIDDEAALALDTVSQYAKWFDMTGTGGDNAPEVWKAWFSWETTYAVAISAHPDRAEHYRRLADRARTDAFSAYSRKEIDFDPAVDTESYTFSTQSIRYYVMAHVTRLAPPLMPPPESVDAAIDSIRTMYWNAGNWVVRKRDVTIRIVPITISSGNWTESTKTVSNVDVSSYTFRAGDLFYATSGTNVVTGEYRVASSSGVSTFTLNESISATAGILSNTDIAGFIVSVNVFGLDSNEVLDSIESRRLYHLNTAVENVPIRWVSPDDYTKLRIGHGSTRDEPLWFRMRHDSDAMIYQFTPIPDTTYSLRAVVLKATPSSPTSVSDTVPFTEFNAEIRPAIRRAVLDRVLTDHGRHNEEMHRQVRDEFESLAAIYQNTGKMDDDQSPRDVYRDVYHQHGWGNMIGGTM
jgi:hypothetical protein